MQRLNSLSHAFLTHREQFKFLYKTSAESVRCEQSNKTTTTKFSEFNQYSTDLPEWNTNILCTMFWLWSQCFHIYIMWIYKFFTQIIVFASRVLFSLSHFVCLILFIVHISRALFRLKLLFSHFTFILRSAIAIVILMAFPLCVEKISTQNVRLVDNWLVYALIEIHAISDHSRIK